MFYCLPSEKGLVVWGFGLFCVFFSLMSNLNFLRPYLLPLPLIHCLPLLRRLLLHHCNGITLSHIQPGNRQLSFPAHECRLQPAHAFYALFKYSKTHLSFFFLLKKLLAFLSSEWRYPQTTRADGTEFFVPNCQRWRVPNIPGKRCFFILQITTHSVAGWESTSGWVVLYVSIDVS